MVEVRAEIAATVWKVEVEVGQAVDAEHELIILESMKMEIPVVAPRERHGQDRARRTRGSGERRRRARHPGVTGSAPLPSTTASRPRIHPDSNTEPGHT